MDGEHVQQHVRGEERGRVLLQLHALPHERGHRSLTSTLLPLPLPVPLTPLTTDILQVRYLHRSGHLGGGGVEQPGGGGGTFGEQPKPGQRGVLNSKEHGAGIRHMDWN